MRWYLPDKANKPTRKDPLHRLSPPAPSSCLSIEVRARSSINGLRVKTPFFPTNSLGRRGGRFWCLHSACRESLIVGRNRAASSYVMSPLLIGKAFFCLYECIFVLMKLFELGGSRLNVARKAKPSKFVTNIFLFARDRDFSSIFALPQEPPRRLAVILILPILTQLGAPWDENGENNFIDSSSHFLKVCFFSVRYFFPRIRTA